MELTNFQVVALTELVEAELERRRRVERRTAAAAIPESELYRLRDYLIDLNNRRRLEAARELRRLARARGEVA